MRAASLLPVLAITVTVILASPYEGTSVFGAGGLPSGAIAWQRGSTEIYASEPKGSASVLISATGDEDLGPAMWSPDGTMIAFQVCLSGEVSLEVADADGDNRHAVAETGFSCSSGPGLRGTWSPDGSMLAFAAADGHIYTAEADGSSAPVDISFDPTSFDSGPTWSPSNDKIAFICSPGDQMGICLMNVDGTNRELVRKHGVRPDVRPGWSPDGTRLAFALPKLIPSHRIYILDLSTGGSTLLNYDAWVHTPPTWSPDGSQIALSRISGQPLVFDVATGDLLWFGSSTCDLWGDQVWSSDSRYLVAYCRTGSTVEDEVTVLEVGTTNEINISNSDAFDAYPAWSSGGPSCAPSPYNALNPCTLERGDILLSSNLGPLYIAQEALFNGYWTHAGLYLGDGQVAESRGRKDCDSWWGGSWLCLSTDPGVETHPLQTSGFWTASDWAILRPTATSSQKDAAADYATLQTGKDYNWNYLNKETTGSFYCSQLVWRAYETVGLDLDSNQSNLGIGSWVGPWGVAIGSETLAAVPPDDIYFDSDVTLVKERPGFGPGFKRTLLRLLSPGNLYVTDPQGRHVGADPTTGESVNEIPGAFYSGSEPHPQFVSVDDLFGTWQVQIIGTETGPYTLAGEAIDRENNSEAELAAAIEPGSVDSYVVSYDETTGDMLLILAGAPVGGIAELPEAAGESLETASSSGTSTWLWLGGAVASLSFAAGIGLVAWRYASRR